MITDILTFVYLICLE